MSDEELKAELERLRNENAVFKKGASSVSADFAGAEVRSRFERDMFHPSLPNACWNAFRSSDYDTAVFEAFKFVEVAVRKKVGFSAKDFGVRLMEMAFDP